MLFIYDLEDLKFPILQVVYAQGEIIYGEGGEFQIGQELLIRTLKKIKKHNRTKAG